MEIPALFYGTAATVRKQCRTALARALRGQQSVLAALTAEGLVDTATHPGLLALDGPSSSLTPGSHFHCYVPLRLLVPGTEQSLGPIDPGTLDAVVSVLLEQPWGVLCLLSAGNMNLWFRYDQPRCYQRFLRAVLRFWPTLDAEGPRYSHGSNDGEPLRHVALPVAQALARVGVPQALVSYHVPLPAGGLAALLAQAKPPLAGDLVDLGTAAAAQPPTPVSPPPGPPAPPPAPPADLVWMSGALRAARDRHDVAAIERLVRTGESPNAQDPEGGDTLLLWAAAAGETDLVRFLLEQGALLEDRGEEGESPLMRAAQQGRRETVELLLERGADPHYVTDAGWDVVAYAELSGDGALVTRLRQARAGSAAAVPASAAMTAAMRAQDPARVQQLIAAGEAVDVLEPDSLQTPLLWAAEEGYRDLVQFLLARGAAVDERSGEGETPLMRAAWAGHTEVVALLLAAGADPQAASDQGWEPTDYAKARGQHEAVVAMIEAALAAD